MLKATAAIQAPFRPASGRPDHIVAERTSWWTTKSAAGQVKTKGSLQRRRRGFVVRTAEMGPAGTGWSGLRRRSVFGGGVAKEPPPQIGQNENRCADEEATESEPNHDGAQHGARAVTASVEGSLRFRHEVYRRR